MSYCAAPRGRARTVAAGLPNRPRCLDRCKFLGFLPAGGCIVHLRGEFLAKCSRQSGATYFIPSEDEWYKAAYYDPSAGVYYDYPTGTDSIPSNDVLSPDPGNNANFDQDGYSIGSPYYMTEVGEFEYSKSPYGTFDQGGNVWEWNEAIIHGSFRGLLGGGYNQVYYNLHAAYRQSYYPAGEYRGVGFRVAMIPEPSNIALLIIFGGIALARWRMMRN